jgi:DNA-binding PadR family transcriptional regulator
MFAESGNIIIFVLYKLFNTNKVVMENDKKLNELLLSWENTYKKGQLTLWIFMALQEGKKYVDEIKNFIEKKSNKTISCEEQSLYRALRKYEHIDVLAYDLKEGNKGPERKYYYMTNLGQELFRQFVNRNIKLFYSEEIKNILKLK